MKIARISSCFGDVIDLYIVYISEFDIFEGGKTIYHVDKVLRETGTVVDDGLHEIFVNTVIDDGTDIAELMHCFMQTEVDNPRFPELTRQAKLLKTGQGGLNAMSSVMQEYIQEAAIESCIKTALEFEVSDERIVELLQKKYNLSETDAIIQLAKYKDNK